MLRITKVLLIAMACASAPAHAQQQSKPTTSVIDYWANFESRATPTEQAKASAVVVSIKLATAMTLASLERKKEMNCVFELSEKDIKRRAILGIQTMSNAQANELQLSQWKAFQWSAWMITASSCGLPQPKDKMFE